MRNCPNCGAPWSTSSDSCLYCGTYMFDLTGIDFTEDTPVYLKIRTEVNGQKCTIGQLCIPRLGSIELSNETSDIMDCRGTVVQTYVTSRHANTDVTFEAIPQKNGEMISLIVDGD